MIGALALLGSKESEGFVETSKLYDLLQGLGFTSEQIDLAVVRGGERNLVEASARRIPRSSENMPQLLRTTAVGLYHATKLSRMFTYIDAVIVDTPILDQGARGDIKNVYLIDDRLDRAQLFRSYLDKCWGLMKGKVVGFDWSECSRDLDKDIKHIRSVLAR